MGKNGITSNYSYETAPYTFELIKSLKRGKALFTQPITPIKCGGAPQKITYLAADYWRKQGVLKDIDIHFYTGGSVIFGVKKYAQTLEKVAKRYGIKMHFLHNLIEIDPINKKAVFEVYKDGKVVDHVTDTYDIIHITPPQSERQTSSRIARWLYPITHWDGWMWINIPSNTCVIPMCIQSGMPPACRPLRLAPPFVSRYLYS